MSKSVIETLLEKHRANVEAREKAEQEAAKRLQSEQDASTEELLREAKNLLGSLADEVTLVEQNITYHNGGLSPAEISEAYFIFRPTGWDPEISTWNLRLEYTGGHPGWWHVWNRAGSDIPLSSADDWQANPRLPELLAMLQDRYDYEVRQRNENRIRAAKLALALDMVQFTSREEALAAMTTLREFPDQVTEWNIYYETWLEEKAEHERTEAEKQELRRQMAAEQEATKLREAAEKQAALDAYRHALTEWHAQLPAVRQRNEERARALQQEVDEPFTVYPLTVQVSATDPEGERYIEDRVYHTICDVPDDDGFWTLVKRGRTVNEKFFAPFSIQRGQTYRPSTAPDGLTETNCRLRVEGEPLRYLVLRDGERVERTLAELEEEPDRPSPTDFGLRWATYDRDVEKLDNEILGLGEIPF